jgi:hypothetical protein
VAPGKPDAGGDGPAGAEHQLQPSEMGAVIQAAAVVYWHKAWSGCGGTVVHISVSVQLVTPRRYISAASLGTPQK